jgi:hypothetical protein
LTLAVPLILFLLRVFFFAVGSFWGVELEQALEELLFGDAGVFSGFRIVDQRATSEHELASAAGYDDHVRELAFRGYC